MHKPAEDEKIFITDGSVAFWDGRPANQNNRHDAELIAGFYDDARNLSPQKWGWSQDKFTKDDEQTFCQELFGHVVKNLPLIDTYPSTLASNEYFERRSEGNPTPLANVSKVLTMLLSVTRDRHDCKGRFIYA